MRPRPTDGELAILQVLWREGGSSVREVQEVMERERPTGYTTVLKMLQIMASKGLVTRDESRRTHIYYPAVTESGTQRLLTTELVDRAFEGSAGQMVLHALGSAPVSADERARIRALLDELEEGGGRR